MRAWNVFLLLLVALVGCMSAEKKAEKKKGKEIARLTAQVVDLENQIQREREESAEVLNRLRTNREERLGRIRQDLSASQDDFAARLEEVSIETEKTETKGE